MQTKPINCVWVVDDDPLQVLILNRFLSGNPSVGRTKFFSGAKSALEILGNSKTRLSDLPELVFLDLVMMRGDGWEFLDYCKKYKSKIGRQPRIVVISSVNEENLNRLKQYPEVNDFLSKPIDRKEFEELMETIVRESEKVN